MQADSKSRQSVISQYDSQYESRPPSTSVTVRQRKTCGECAADHAIAHPAPGPRPGLATRPSRTRRAYENLDPYFGK